MSTKVKDKIVDSGARNKKRLADNPTTLDEDSEVIDDHVLSNQKEQSMNDLEKVHSSTERDVIEMASSKNILWWSSYKEIWMNTVMDFDYVPESSTHLSAMLLHIKRNEMNRGVSIYASKGGRGNVGFSNNEMPYDRIFLFGSLGIHTCFIILSSSVRKSSYLLQ